MFRPITPRTTLDNLKKEAKALGEGVAPRRSRGA